MKSVSEIYKKHPILFIICVILCVLCAVYLIYGYVANFTKEQLSWNHYFSDWYSLFLTTAIALIVYLFVDKKTSDKIDIIKKIEKNIQEDTKNINEITTKMQSNINKLENSVQKISEVQDKMAFETEKNRLINFAQYSSLSEEDKRSFRSNMISIFHELKYQFRQDQDNNSFSNSFAVIFIKNNNGLPKMFHPFGRRRDFPYFCVRVIKKYHSVETKDNEIQIDSHYYLSYDFSDRNWRLSERYPIEGSSTCKSFKVSFFGTNFVGNAGPSAEEFCNNC